MAFQPRNLFSCLLTKLAQSAFSLQPLRADRIVIAVAGAIEGGRYAKVTNADWSVDLRDPALAGLRIGPRSSMILLLRPTDV